MKTLGPTESELHRSVAEMLDWVLRPPAMYTTFPAGWGALNKATAGRLKACGLKMGMPDILVFYHGVTFGIELKGRGGILSAAQKVMHANLRAAGVPVVVCSSVEGVFEFCKAYGLPMRKWRFQHGNQITAGSSAAQSA